ncbi:MAG: PHP domain-containing protein [Aetokthonos hydrillicola CCALA 1050]|nr:PHP domain-containing protein [Aetokthonos hydrillicola CCALA 1050]MBW4589533.1 PHP domain-containing protein [Aetokthonos hydrillicola CCALA 1050]
MSTVVNHNSTDKTYRFKRFLDLQWFDINCDLHMHTSQTDGKATIPQILQLSVNQGLNCVAFTEHVRKDTTWFSEFAQEVRSYAEVYPQLKVLVGCEAKALNATGGFDVSEEILAECDLVLGSVHRFPNNQGGYINVCGLTPEGFAQIEFELALGLLKYAPMNVLAHPGGMYSRLHGEFPAELMRELMKVSLERKIAIEINTSYVRNLPNFLQLCAEVNPFVSIGSDVHRLEQLANCRDQLYGLGVGTR